MRATCGVMSARTPSRRPDSGSTTLNVCRSRSRAGAGQQRIEMLDQRRLHEPVAVRAKVVEQRAAQRFERARPRRAARPRCARAGASYAWRTSQQRDEAEQRSTTRPTKRICPSDSSIELAKRLAPEARRDEAAARLRGSARSANAAQSESGTRDSPRAIASATSPVPRPGAPSPPPDCLKYWKNSELGSSTIMSLRPRNVALYASRLR